MPEKTYDVNLEQEVMLGRAVVDICRKLDIPSTAWVNIKPNVMIVYKSQEFIEEPNEDDVYLKITCDNLRNGSEPQFKNVKSIKIHVLE